MYIPFREANPDYQITEKTAVSCRGGNTNLQPAPDGQSCMIWIANEVPNSCAFMSVGSGDDAAVYLWPGFNDRGNPILDCENPSTAPDAVNMSAGDA